MRRRRALLALPCIPAPTSVTSGRADVHDIAELLKASPRGRVQHRGRSSPGTARARAEGAADAMHAGAGASRARLRARRDGCRTRRSRACGRWSSGMKKIGVRVSMFVDPVPEAVRWAAAVGGDRVELYTEPFARAFEAGRGEESFETYADGRRARTFAWPRRQRGARSRSEESLAVPPAPASCRRCRSVTRSSAMRYTSGSSGRCVTISMRFDNHGCARSVLFVASRRGCCLRARHSTLHAAPGRRVTFRAEDGATLSGVYYEPSRRPAPGIVSCFPC